VVLATQQQEVVRAVDVTRVVGIVTRAEGLLRADVRNLGDHRGHPAVPEDQRLAAPG
jgi:hypothetical protein